MIDFGLDPAGTEQAAAAARPVAVSGRSAARRPAGAARDRRGAEPEPRRRSKSCGCCRTSRPRSRSCCRSCSSASRTCATSSPRRSSSSCASGITVSYHLPPLDADETGHYINHRLRRAALGAPLEFPREATDLIHARSRGVPRIINVICDAALVFGYAEERRAFDAATVHDVLAELETTGVLPPVVAAARRRSRAASGRLRGGSGRGPAARRGEPSTTKASSPRARRGGFGVPAAVDATVAAGSGRDERPDHRQTEAASAREHAVRAARAEELAGQRRVLAEEYRLLRRPAAPSGARGRRPSTPRRSVSTADHADGFWERLKRIMLGVSLL